MQQSLLEKQKISKYHFEQFLTLMESKDKHLR